MTEKQAEYKTGDQIKESPRIKLRKIAGCYILWKNDISVYVGQSTNIIARVGIHSEKGKINFDEYTYCELDQPTKEQLNELEANLIIKYSPSYNRLLPDNKKYANIKTLRRKNNISKWTIRKSGVTPIFKDIYDKDELKAAGVSI